MALLLSCCTAPPQQSAEAAGERRTWAWPDLPRRCGLLCFHTATIASDMVWSQAQQQGGALDSHLLAGVLDAGRVEEAGGAVQAVHRHARNGDLRILVVLQQGACQTQASLTGQLPSLRGGTTSTLEGWHTIRGTVRGSCRRCSPEDYAALIPCHQPGGGKHSRSGHALQRSFGCIWPPGPLEQ